MIPKIQNCLNRTVLPKYHEMSLVCPRVCAARCNDVSLSTPAERATRVDRYEKPLAIALYDTKFGQSSHDAESSGAL
jgi:hypothetical protein